MQSSFGHVVRAVVMLGCLAAVPVLAIYGKQLQEFGRAVWETYQTHIHARAGDNNSAGEAGGAAPPWPAPATGPAADHGSPAGAWPTTSLANEPQHLSAPWGQSNSLPTVASGDKTSQSGSAPSEVQQASFTGSTGPDGPLGGVRGAGGSPPSAPMHIAGDATSSPASQSQDGTNCTVEFRRIEQRLRELGATYYLLETWGRTGDRYRFLCRMALTGNTDFGADRIFLATDSDPLRAMQNVLQQAEQWRSGRTQ